MHPDELLRRTCETDAGYLALGNERFEADGAVFVRNRATPRRHDANHVGLIRARSPEEIDTLLDRAKAEFVGQPQPGFYTDPLTPPEFVGRLALDGGYSEERGLHLILEGELVASPPLADIREVLSDAGWRAYRELADQNYTAKSATLGDASLLSEFHNSTRAKAPAVRTWLAYVENRPAAFFSSWPGANGVGMVEDLYTHPDYRHRGLATALLVHSVADARGRGAGPVLIVANPDDTPKNMYAALGFRPMYVGRKYSPIARQP